MAVGRISGPLLKSNLVRNGVDLAFETDLLYLDVNNSRIGVNTASPQYDLDVAGTLNATNLRASGTLTVGTIQLSGNSITNPNGNLLLGTADEVIYQNRLTIDSMTLVGNTISTNESNANLEIDANGTGTIELLADTNVTGNLHATGNISANGNITLGDADTDNITINAEIASDVIPDANNTYNLGSTAKRWDNVWATTVTATDINSTTLNVGNVNLGLTHDNIYYVAKGGNDSNAGLHQNNPVLTITKALTLATAGDTIHVYPGDYVEVFPMTIPAGVTVKGHSMRTVNITPTAGTNNNDAFLLNGEVTVEDLTVKDFFFNSGANEGYAFKFATNITVTSRSPYIRNVTVITAGSVVSSGDPRGFDQGDAGCGAYLDGQVAHATSKEAGCLFHAVTFITPGVNGLSITNGTRVEWLNSFTYFASKGLYAVDGTAGLKNAGKTTIRVGGLSGSFAAAETFVLKSIDGSTVLGTGTIASKDTDNKFYIAGKLTGVAESTKRTAKNQSAVGAAQLSTTQKKFGSASLLLDGDADYVSMGANDDFGFGTGDFTLECFIRLDNVSGVQTVFDLRAGLATDITPTLLIDGTALKLNVADVTRITGGTLSANTWHHIAVSRLVNTTKLYLDGTMVGTTILDNNNYGTSKPVRLGATFAGTDAVDGYIDDVRISKSARYSSDAGFTVATAALVGDIHTKFLSHFNGTAGLTTFEEDVKVGQNIEFSGGATATYIDLFDVTDFGGELRAIGSANVYGTHGAYGDGPGVKMYLVGQNFAYIGNGKAVDNDNSTVVQANEVVEANSAKVQFTSVDHRGDFRVGDAFFVDQETGQVQFNTANLEVITTNGLTFQTGSATTFIDGTKLETGDFRISGSTIQTLTTDMTISSVSGSIILADNTSITGNLDVTGNVTIGGDITIGDADTDSIQFTGDIDSNVTPNITATYNLGSVTKRWNHVYANELDLDNINITGNRIRTSDSNSDLELSANGTGTVSVPSNNFTVSGTTQFDSTATFAGNVVAQNDLQVAGNITQTSGVTSVAGDLNVSGGVTIAGQASFENINIQNNTISTTDTNSDLELGTSGTGDVTVPGSNLAVTGNISVAGTTTLASLIATGNITANSLNVNTLSVNGAFQFENIQIDDNIISTTHSNSDLELRANGTGVIRLPSNNLVIEQNLNVLGAFTPRNLNVSDTATITGNLNVSGTTSILGQAFFENIQITGNLLRTTDSDSDLELEASGSGVVRVSNSNVVVDNNLTVSGNTVLDSVTAGNITTGNIVVNDTMTINGQIDFEDIQINDNIITTTLSNSDLELKANGTGSVVIPNDNVVITNDLQINGTTNFANVQSTSGFNANNATITGILSVTGIANFEDIRIDDNFITTTASNSNLELRANGTGTILVPTNNVVITNDLTVNGTVTLNELDSTGKITANSFTTGDILIDDNFVTTTTSNSNLELRANGSGSVVTGNFSFNTNVLSTDGDMVLTPASGILQVNSTDSILLPKGTTAQRNASPVTGMTRYNTTTNKFEGYNGSWVELSTKLEDQDGDTKITAEITPGANDNIIRFYNAGTLTASLEATKFVTNKLEVADIEIDSSTIKTISTNTDLNLLANGTGSVVIDNFSIKNNIITNTVSNSNTVFENTGNGYFKFGGTRGIVIPVGADAQRPIPSDSELGMTRYNTQAARVELYDGTNWVSVAGSSGGISFGDAESLALEYVLALG
jgi:cytoskeletal protein CcmA (bactofilin family)